MLDYCVENSIDRVVVGGDLLHGKSIIYAIAQSCLLDIFRDYRSIKFTIISGNHDLSLKGKDAIPALKSIDNEPNVCRIKDVFYSMLLRQQTILSERLHFPEDISFFPAFRMVRILRARLRLHMADPAYFLPERQSLVHRPGLPQL